MLQRGAILSGKYRIDGVLGEGGMAVVYAVTHLRNTARLAVKVLHADSLLKSNIRARFVREGKVANSVNHPGAVQMIDDGVAEDGSPYLVMEYLSGVSVACLGSRALPLGAALNIAYQVLDVLRAAHENGIIHRDIKPANLFVLRDGRVKVLDFGISRLHDGAEPFDSAATGSVMGTPFFMAPEQARAEAAEIDARTDVFAVGASLFTLISGQYLYTGNESRQVMIQAATEPARSLLTVAPGTPRAVIDLVAKAVAYERDARWESAQAMQDAVRKVHEDLCGPIGFDALAMLALGHEFRRRSHAKLTGPQRSRSWASGHLDASALSTTLPALAGTTRSRDSVDPARHSSSNRERMSEAPELAGWTGHVPASLKPSATQRIASQLARPFRKARLVRSALLAAAVCVLIFGFNRFQAQPRAVATKPLVNSDVSLAALPRAVSPDINATATLSPVPSAPIVPRSSVRRPVRSGSSTKGAPSRKPLEGPPPSKPLEGPPPSKPLTRDAERLNDVPILISPPDLVMR